MAAILEARVARKAQTDPYMRSILLAYESKLVGEFIWG